VVQCQSMRPQFEILQTSLDHYLKQRRTLAHIPSCMSSFNASSVLTASTTSPSPKSKCTIRRRMLDSGLRKRIRLIHTGALFCPTQNSLLFATDCFFAISQDILHVHEHGKFEQLATYTRLQSASIPISSVCNLI
jgi:hypothetical protein